MTQYVMVETRDPFESRDVPSYYELATQLADKGDSVTLFLVQNAVLAVRKAAADNPLSSLLEGKVEVLADAFSLRERGISEAERSEGVKTAEIDDLVDLVMADGTRTMWH
jgi:sulfur relay (sulfurtransferase) complex TusBCD TusD component (DsrE family)